MSPSAVSGSMPSVRLFLRLRANDFMTMVLT